MTKRISLAIFSGFLGEELSELANALKSEGVLLERFDENDGDEFFLSGCRAASGTMDVTRNREGKIKATFLYGIEDPDQQIELSEIPFASSRDDLRLRLGQPEWTREAFEDRILGWFPPSDRYHFPEHHCLVSCQYDDQVDAVTKITLMPVDWTPGQ